MTHGDGRGRVPRSGLAASDLLTTGEPKTVESYESYDLPNELFMDRPTRSVPRLRTRALI